MTNLFLNAKFKKSLLLILLLICPVAADAMQMVASGEYAVLTEGVMDSDYVRLKELLRLNPGIRTIVLRDSKGGDTWAGFKLAEVIRDNKLNTAASGRCFSACATIFMGGIERRFTDDKLPTMTLVGFHPSFFLSTGIVFAEETYTLRNFVIQQAGEKLDKSLLDEVMRSWDKGNRLFFYDFNRPGRADNVTVFTCSPADKNVGRDCRKRPGINAFTEGIITHEGNLTLPESIRLKPPVASVVTTAETTKGE